MGTDHHEAAGEIESSDLPWPSEDWASDFEDYGWARRRGDIEDLEEAEVIVDGEQQGERDA
jgi:hypothetical protein